MFTGIVQATGEILARDRRGDGVRLRVDAEALGTADVAIGESVAVSGCCLTVVARDGDRLDFDVSAETLRCVAGFDAVSRAWNQRRDGNVQYVRGLGLVVRPARQRRDRP